VTATAIPFEIPIDVFARLTLAAEGWTVVAGKWFPGPRSLFFDVTATRVVGGVTQVRRTSLRAVGGNVVAVHTLSAREQ
jgi:hypothetical protein